MRARAAPAKQHWNHSAEIAWTSEIAELSRTRANFGCNTHFNYSQNDFSLAALGNGWDSDDQANIEKVCWPIFFKLWSWFGKLDCGLGFSIFESLVVVGWVQNQILTPILSFWVFWARKRRWILRTDGGKAFTKFSYRYGCFCISSDFFRGVKWQAFSDLISTAKNWRYFILSQIFSWWFGE